MEVIDTEGVEYSRKKHAFTDESELTVSFQVRQRVVVTLVDTAQFQQLSDRVSEEDADEDGDRDHQFPFGTPDQQRQEAHVEVRVHS